MTIPLREKRRNAEKHRRLRIGVDVDGVLADQIRGVLPRIKQRHGVTLTPEQVIHWKLPIGDTDIAQEIVAAMTSDTDYVRSMRPHDGAVPAIRALYRENWLVVVTARPKDIEKTSFVDYSTSAMSSLPGRSRESTRPRSS